MHRTQILLKNHQYQALKEMARREGKSLSDLVRTAVAHWLGQDLARASSQLAHIRALGRDPNGPAARDHDSLLYGWERE